MRPPLPTWTFWLLLIAVVGVGAGMYVAPPDAIRVGAFSEASPSERTPPGWVFNDVVNGHKQTTYELVESEEGVVVRAHSEGGLSSLQTDRRINLHTHPILEWRWKVDRLVETADMRKRTRSDYTAAVAVNFDHKLSLLERLKHFVIRITGYHVSSNRVLFYLWANQLDKGTVHEDIHIDWFTHLVVRSGSTHVGRWVTERRNVFEDYRSIFGEEPPPVVRVSITTQTSSTRAPATAYYGDIIFRTAADSLVGPSLDTRHARE